MIVDGQRLVAELVGNLDAEQRRARGDFLDQRVAEIAGEQLVEVVELAGTCGYFVAARTVTRAVEALGLEGDVVGCSPAPG